MVEKRVSKMPAISNQNPEATEEFRVLSMREALQRAHDVIRIEDDEDPDPYGFVSEAELEYGVGILPDVWKSKPDEDRWNKRLRGRARRFQVGQLYIKGFTAEQIAQKLEVNAITVVRDLANISVEWKRSYIHDIETLASRDLAALDYLLQKLEPKIEIGDTKAITTALEIIKHRSDILGTKQGMTVDIEQYIREVAESNGYDPEKAVGIAQRISVTMR